MINRGIIVFGIHKHVIKALLFALLDISNEMTARQLGDF